MMLSRRLSLWALRARAAAPGGLGDPSATEVPGPGSPIALPRGKGSASGAPPAHALML